MVQARERVRTHALGGITRGLLKEIRLALDFEGFPLVWRRYHIPGRGKIKNKVVVSRSRFYFPQGMRCAMQNVRR